ncbi:MAG: DUF1080 domain-containing protein [Planctomycetes bacterium]|nr:DUF1080 domain-containing protein [Planctomycetota bacterium]
MLRIICFSIFAALFVFAPATVHAQQNRRERAELAVTDLTQVDGDFHYQGEYAGRVRGRFGEGPVGLQVVALGGGRFQAMEYRGGLPGQGWDRRTRESYTGVIDGDFLRLSAPGRNVTIQIGRVVIRDLNGRQLGVLDKVRRSSPTLGALPPRGATVLFNGTSTEHFTNAKITEDGLLMPGTMTSKPYRDFRLHVEFRTPYMPFAREQGRGNSGVYIQERYEVQILDSFGLTGEFNECGGLYRFKAPDLNMCLPPLIWQTYDIYFRAARFDGSGQKIANAVITAMLNGVGVQNNVQLQNKTGGGKQEGPDDRPILLQNHRNPVHFRNIWIVDYSPGARATTVAAR